MTYETLYERSRQMTWEREQFVAEREAKNQLNWLGWEMSRQAMFYYLDKYINEQQRLAKQ